MALLDRGDLPALASFGLTDELVGFEGTDILRLATFDQLLSDLGIWRVLAASAVQVSHTGTTAETALATVTVPANALGANGILRITSLWSNNNNANTKTPRIRYSTITGTTYNAISPTTNLSHRLQCQIANRNATNSQVGATSAVTGFGQGAGAVATGAVDTTASSTIILSGQLANAGDTMAIESYIVEILKKA